MCQAFGKTLRESCFVKLAKKESAYFTLAECWQRDKYLSVGDVDLVQKRCEMFE